MPSERRNYFIEKHPQLFNKEHIDYVKKWASITAGEIPFDEVEWQFGEWGHMRNWVYYRSSLRECDTMFFIFYCHCCGRKSRFLFHYEPPPLHYESLIAADKFMQDGFECKHCGREYYADEEGNIYFKQVIKSLS